MSAAAHGAEHPQRPTRVLLATRSPGKTREIAALFAAAGLRTWTLADAGIPESPREDDLETAVTFEENALLKARYFHALTGAPVVADDSGLEVVALGGAPGVYSKRWSGRTDLRGQALDDANNALLMERLSGAADRRARYVCAAVYCANGVEVVARGTVEGTLLRGPRGRGGFGYDPFFVPAELDGRTFGEVSQDEKARISHRARAFTALLRRLASSG